MRKYVFGLLIVLMFFIIACEKVSTNSQNDKFSGLVEGIDFDQLFAVPTAQEIQNIQNEWIARTNQIIDVTIEDTIQILIDIEFHNMYIISHTNSENVKHYGAVIFPADTTQEFPVMFYNHGGDNGVDLNSFRTLLSLPTMKEIAQKFIIAIPSFRSETLIWDSTKSYQSTGSPSPWDKDVDDCIDFLTTISDLYSQVDESTVYAVGISRGAAVSMLWAARDERVDKVVDFFGPTDMISQWTKEVVYNALNGTLEDLPGLDYLNEEIIQPLKIGNLTIATVRNELIKRSSVYFLSDIVPLQVHHGMADEIVPVDQAERLIEVASELDLSNEDFQSFLYEGIGHDENTFLRGMDEMKDFLLSQ